MGMGQDYSAPDYRDPEEWTVAYLRGLTGKDMRPTPPTRHHEDPWAEIVAHILQTCIDDAAEEAQT
jgi:hypothetical protein